MRTKNVLTVVIVLITTLFFSCKKEKDEEPAPTNNTTTTTGFSKQLLLNKNWKLTAAMLGTFDYYTMLNACEKDNITNFFTDSTYVIDEGTTKCDSLDPQTYQTGTWVFTSSDTKMIITISGNATPDTATILQLDSSVFKLKIKKSLGEATVTYTKQ